MLGFSWKGRVGLVLVLGDLKMGLEKMVRFGLDVVRK